MFSSKEHLDRKTGPYGVGRFSYLQSLVNEFQDSDSTEAKEQVLANLANFAYDPINYDFLRTLNVIDLFIDCLDETNEKFVQFATGGLCNLALDKQNKAYILKNGGVDLLIKCLSSSNVETVIQTVTTLMFLVTQESKPEITTLPVIDVMLRFRSSSNRRLSNLASVFLEDYCTPAQIAEAMQAAEDLDEADVEEPSSEVPSDMPAGSSSSMTQ